MAGGLYRSLWRYSRGARAALLGGAALLTASQLVRLAMPWLAGQAINVLQTAEANFGLRAGGWICALIATCIVGWALHGPGRVLERVVGIHIRRGVSEALFDKLAAAPLKWHDRHAASDLQQRMTQASGALDRFAQTQYIVLQSTVTFVGTLTALVLFSPATGAIAVAAYAALVVISMRFDRSMTRLAQQENDAERRYASGVLGFVGSIVTISALRLQPSAKRLLGSRLDAIAVPLKQSIRLNETKWCVVDLLTTVLTWSVVALYVWRAHGAGGVVLIGGVFMVYQYAEQAGAVVSAAAAHLQGFARLRADYASASPIWDAPTKPDATAAVKPDWRRIDLHAIDYRHEPAASPDGTIQSPVGIRHVSLALERGERIALVGPSGAGKSTLMRVMAGLYDPSHGHVTVDGVAHFEPRPLASITTFFPQDADVFESTVRENIVLDGSPDDRTLAAALEISAFDAVLATMPQGLSTPIGERGTNLSGGERQRLCLARGVIAAADSSLILLDEPTSALDPLTEAHVHRALRAGFPSACIVASVHRMSLLEHFDRVVLMIDGAVVDTGGVDELRARHPLFDAMVEVQGGAESVPAAA